MTTAEAAENAALRRALEEARDQIISTRNVYRGLWPATEERLHRINQALASDTIGADVWAVVEALVAWMEAVPRHQSWCVDEHAQATAALDRLRARGLL